MCLKNKIIIKIVTISSILAVWFFATNYCSVNTLFLPSPQKVIKCLGDIINNGYKNISLIEHFEASMERLLIAFFLAVITAIPLGILSGFSAILRTVLEPIINFYRPLPPLAYYTLLVIWLGIGNESKIVLLYLACFAPLYISCSVGVTRIEKKYIQNAEALGAKKHQVLVSVVFPFILPDIFTGMRTSIGVGYTTLVAAEMVAARNGIGWMVLDAGNYLRSDVVFVGIIIMGITGMALDLIICSAEKIIVPWKGKNI